VFENPSPFEISSTHFRIADYEDLMESWKKQKGAIWDAGKTIQAPKFWNYEKREKTDKFARGENWAYSIFRIRLLGLIVAKGFRKHRTANFCMRNFLRR